MPSPAGISTSASRAEPLRRSKLMRAPPGSRRDSTRWSLQRSDIAAIVAVGFMPLEVGQMLPSKMNRLGMSCARPQASTTDVAGSIAHLGRAQQMPAGFANERRDDRFVRAGRLQRFLGSREMKVEQPMRVFRHAIDDLRRGDAVAVLELGIEHDAVLLVGQVLGDDAPHGRVAQPLANAFVKARAPDRVVAPRIARVIETGPPVGCRPHLAPRTKPRDASVS